MNREIKFRAWDKERKEMRQIQLMDWSDWWVSTGHTWEREKGLEYGERNSFKNEETDRDILMQYTGLKDRNGKEIYEGDLCSDENGTVAPIEWVQDHCQFLWMYEGDVQEIGEWCIVVGNIYEGEKTG